MLLQRSHLVTLPLQVIHNLPDVFVALGLQLQEHLGPASSSSTSATSSTSEQPAGEGDPKAVVAG